MIPTLIIWKYDWVMLCPKIFRVNDKLLWHKQNQRHFLYFLNIVLFLFKFCSNVSKNKSLKNCEINQNQKTFFRNFFQNLFENCFFKTFLKMLFQNFFSKLYTRIHIILTRCTHRALDAYAQFNVHKIHIHHHTRAYTRMHTII